MKISYQWLQEYFDDPLPASREITELLTIHAFEVEDVEETDADTILDIDILPNRAHDCLSHRGVAREVALLTGRKMRAPDHTPPASTSSAGVSVAIQDPALCRRYIGQLVEGVNVTDSPDWLKARLEALEQRSINLVVDITNYVMLETGQPMHAFDADKLEGEGIVVRTATEGEMIRTLDGDDVTLDASVLVIADDTSSEGVPLAIAGVKGGTKAEVDASTRRVIFEAANFHPQTVRRTARGYGIITDAAKRFENDITPEGAGAAMDAALTLLTQHMQGTAPVIGARTDTYPRRPGTFHLGIRPSAIDTLLGTSLSEEYIHGILADRLGFDMYSVPDPAQQVCTDAPQYEGAPYAYGASITYDAPEAFDCASFVAYLFSRAGVPVPRMTVDQYVYGTEVSREEMQPGDVVFARNHDAETTDTYTRIEDGTEVTQPVTHYVSREFMPGTEVPEGVDHNGIYLGNGKIIHASGKWHKGAVVIEDINESLAFVRIQGVRRMVSDAEEERMRWVIRVPSERLDLRRPEDVIEEVARVHGYQHIEATSMEREGRGTPEPHFTYSNLIRTGAHRAGFSDIYTYSFRSTGPRKVANPIADDKRALRKDLTEEMFRVLAYNMQYADLIGTDSIRVCEIGTVFTKKGEYTACAFGVANKKGVTPHPRTVIEDLLTDIEEHCGRPLEGAFTERHEGVVWEGDLEAWIEQCPPPEGYGEALWVPEGPMFYTPVSPYPFVTRDVSVWVPQDVSEDTVRDVITHHAGTLLVRTPRLFDRFEKEAHVSYAFRLVFQSQERTLTDDEVNEIMEAVYTALDGHDGWEAR